MDILPGEVRVEDLADSVLGSFGHMVKEKGLSLHVVFMLIPMLHNYKREAHAGILRDLTQIVEAGGLKPVLDETQFSFEEVGQAHARLESGQAMGKVVVEN